MEHHEVWMNYDPRNTVSQCNRSWAKIVILRPNDLVGIADVYVEYGWSIRTSFVDYPNITMNDKWDPLWRWTFTPWKTK